MMYLISNFAVPVFAFDISEIKSRYQENQWWLGKNLTEGDYFIYEVCNSESFTKSTLSGHCYDISLEFVSLLQTGTGGAWIVQAQIVTDEEKKIYAIFQIDETTFDVTTYDKTAIEYADSVQETIFYMKDFADPQTKKHLKIGNSWGAVESYVTPDPQMTVREKTNTVIFDEQVSVYDVGFVILEQTSVLISKEIPFPVDATVYDPHRIVPTTPTVFTFELLEHHNVNSDVYEIDIFDDDTLDAIRQESLEFDLQHIVDGIEYEFGDAGQ